MHIDLSGKFLWHQEWRPSHPVTVGGGEGEGVAGHCPFCLREAASPGAAESCQMAGIWWGWGRDTMLVTKAQGRGAWDGAGVSPSGGQAGKTQALVVSRSAVDFVLGEEAEGGSFLKRHSVCSSGLPAVRSSWMCDTKARVCLLCPGY